MRPVLPALLVPIALLLLGAGPPKTNGSPIALPGLNGEVRVLTDEDGVRHIVAGDDADLARAQGFVHCRDRSG